MFGHPTPPPAAATLPVERRVEEPARRFSHGTMDITVSGF